MADPERVFISPTEMVRSLNKFHTDPNERVSELEVNVDGVGAVVIDGGPVKFQGSSWTERNYRLEVPTEEGVATVRVSADPADDAANFRFTATRGAESWSIFSREDPPQWLQNFAGALGVGSTVSKVS